MQRVIFEHNAMQCLEALQKQLALTEEEFSILEKYTTPKADETIVTEQPTVNLTLCKKYIRCKRCGKLLPETSFDENTNVCKFCKLKEK